MDILRRQGETNQAIALGCMSAFVGVQKQAGIAIGEFRLVMVV